MRSLTLLCGLYFCAVTLAQQSTPLSIYLAEFPNCATECAVPVISSLGYSHNSISEISAILCPDVPSMRSISGCLQTNCSYADTAAAWPFQQNLCQDYPVPSRAAYIRNLTITLALLAAVLVVLRCYSRVRVTKKVWWDDWNTAIAALFMIMIAVAMIWDSTIGLGLHAWDVASPENLVKIVKVFYVMKLFYVIVQVLLKVSILLFYLRVFPVPWIQNVTWILIGFILLHGIAFFFPVLLQCTPVALLWDKRLEGRCILFKTVNFPGAIFSIVEDLAILVLPIPCLSKLNIGRGKKISLIGMFGIGIIACIISIIRIRPVLDYQDTLDQSWDTIHLLAWSEAELTVATICVCLPSLKPILNHHAPRYFGTSPSMGFVVGNLSPEPSRNTDRNVISNVEREYKQNWLTSRPMSAMLPSLGIFAKVATLGKRGNQLNERNDSVNGSKVRRDGTIIQHERGDWRENDRRLEEGLGHPSQSSEMMRSPRTVLTRERKISILMDRNPRIEKIKHVRSLSEATYDSSITPPSTAGSHDEERVLNVARGEDTLDQEQTCDMPSRQPSRAGKPPQIANNMGVPTFLVAGSTRGAEVRGTSEDSDVASNEIGSWSSRWSWSSRGARESAWRIDSVRISRFRISTFESRSEGSSLAERLDSWTPQ